MNTYQGVLAGVVILWTSEHLHADFVLVKGGVRFLKSALSQIQEQFAQPIRSFEWRAPGYSMQ